MSSIEGDSTGKGFTIDLAVIVVTFVFFLAVVLAIRGGWLWDDASTPESEAKPRIVVFCAASVEPAMYEILLGYEKAHEVEIAVSAASSGTLARQIESGARCEIFISANSEWMDFVAEKNLIDVSSRVDLLRNSLVLVRNADFDFSLDFETSAEALRSYDDHLAIGDPAGVPAGKYAKEALTNLGLWSALEPRFVFAADVRSALMYVERGEAPLGIVYQSDALASKHVRVVDEFPASSHSRIVYPAALMKEHSDEAESFFEYLSSSEAKDAFAKFGFE
ncbi:MAG: molybdate ABC transporter substrate-binding protein [Planctomycetes bacterium]|nr:molybdate ABC transporter substrate-binding protein [Planctomycetota bacterium]